MVLVHATSAQGAQRHADATLAEAARASLAEAADRMLQGTREIGLFALSLVGIDYRYGGESPERGLDCSGLIRYVFQHVTGVTLPRTAQELSRIGKDIRAADLEPGDLVFFNTRRFAFSHVGIYLGNDRFIHAPSRGGEVGVASLGSAYWQKRYNGARRLVGVLPALMPSLIAHAEAERTGRPGACGGRRAGRRGDRGPAALGPVNAMGTNALHGRKRPAQGAKATAGRVPGETLQRSDGRFWQQPGGNGWHGAPLRVVLLAKTRGLRFVGRLDWRPMPAVRVCVHSVNRP